MFCGARCQRFRRRQQLRKPRDFIERVNTALLASSIERLRTQWVGRTYITEDTEILTASATPAGSPRETDLSRIHRFDNLTHPIWRVKLCFFVAMLGPLHPTRRSELRPPNSRRNSTACTAKANTGGRASPRQCLGIDDLDVRMAKSR